MKVVVVLAMHGVPPRDFPRGEIIEFFGLQARLEHGGEGSESLKRRYAELDTRIRTWPRTPENDPFFAASQALAREIRQATGWEVITGFNEFCAPDLDQALEEAAARAPGKVVVITPMATPGGEHSEVDIPLAISRARERRPGVEFIYAWPFEVGKTAEFLAAQIARFLQ